MSVLGTEAFVTRRFQPVIAARAQMPTRVRSLRGGVNRRDFLNALSQKKPRGEAGQEKRISSRS
jgi:hypothetical protein